MLPPLRCPPLIAKSIPKRMAPDLCFGAADHTHIHPPITALVLSAQRFGPHIENVLVVTKPEMALYKAAAAKLGYTGNGKGSLREATYQFWMESVLISAATSPQAVKPESVQRIPTKGGTAVHLALAETEKQQMDAVAGQIGLAARRSSPATGIWMRAALLEACIGILGAQDPKVQAVLALTAKN